MIGCAKTSPGIHHRPDDAVKGARSTRQGRCHQVHAAREEITVRSIAGILDGDQRKPGADNIARGIAEILQELAWIALDSQAQTQFNKAREPLVGTLEIAGLL